MVTSTRAQAIPDYATRTRRSFFWFVIGILGLVAPLWAYPDLLLGFLLVLATTPLFVLSADAGLRIARDRPLVLFWVVPAMCLSLFGVLYWAGAIVGLVSIVVA